MLFTLLASNVIVVAPTLGPGVDFTSIQAAMTAAQSGDIVLVREGPYLGHVTMPSGIDLTVVADGALPPQSVQAVWNVEQLQPSQTFTLRGINLNGADFPAQLTTTTLQAREGNVLVEDCTIGGSRSCVRSSGSSWLALTRCSLFASSTTTPTGGVAIGNALETWLGASSLATLHVCALRGGSGLFGQASGIVFAVDGNLAMQWVGKLLIANSKIEGGKGAGAGPGSFASCISGAPASALSIAGTAHLAVSTVVAGAQGPALGGCALPPTPPAIVGDTTEAHAGTSPLLSSSRVTREGQTLAATLEAASGEYGVLLAATSVQRVELDAYVGVLVNPAASVIPLGFVGGTGSISTSAVVQDLGAGVEGAVVFLQGASVDLSTLSVRLSNVSVATLLDAGL